MIESFRDRNTERVFKRQNVRGLGPDVQRIARRKLVQLNSAVTLDDLRVPPGNRLKALKGDRKGQYSIRINDQFRVCFRWEGAGAEDVEITDYH